MDRHRFDDIRRVLDTRASRRGAFGVVAGAAGLGASGLAWLGDAGARKKGKKQKKKSAVCRRWVLTGKADPNGSATQLRVDDDITIFVNGLVVARDDDQEFSEVGPFTFSARRGDQLRMVAIDTGAGWYELDPLYLRCARGGKARKLSDGFPRTESDPDPVGTFFDETFTI